VWQSGAAASPRSEGEQRTASPLHATTALRYAAVTDALPECLPDETSLVVTDGVE